MENIKAFIFTLEEFKKICDKVLEGKTCIENDSSGWFWVTTEEIDEKEVI